jgi:hypothetical protein
MHHLLTLLIALFAGTGAGMGAAPAADRRYAIADFDRVIVEGPYVVTLTVGQPSSAVGRGSAQALEAVTVDVQGTTLRIRRNPGAWGGTPGRAPEPATITLSTRNLRSVRVIGTGSLDLSGARGLRVDLSVEGSGRLRARALAADTLALAMRGSGDLELAGTAKAVTADLQGSGSVDGTALTTETATIFAATSGNIILSARRSAKVTAHGVGDVVIVGTPACTISGPSAGQVRCGQQP